MDLSDGSDGEGDYELDENALLGSDDEDAGIVIVFICGTSFVGELLPTKFCLSVGSTSLFEI